MPIRTKPSKTEYPPAWEDVVQTVAPTKTKVAQAVAAESASQTNIAPVGKLIWEVGSEGTLIPIYRFGRETIFPAWAPQEGSVELFLSCPVFEVLFSGTRGVGKTDALLFDFAQHCGRGFGAEWRGVLFRQTYKQLSDLIAKTLKWFPLIFPQAKYNRSEHTWTWPGGEQLLLRYMKTPSDYWNYHGHAFPWIGFEELTNWATPECYLLMMSCCRSTNPRMPRKYRATTNPYGAGHNWIKKRFRLPHMFGKVIRDSMREGKAEPHRVAVHGDMSENKVLLHADPEYIQRIIASARNPAELAAWVYGSWDITSGGMFDDLWDSSIHVVDDFPFDMIPRAWRIDRSFDWGSSKPFSVGWWAESNGEPFTWKGRTYGRVRGDLYRIAEWYGWNGTRNEGVKMTAVSIAQGILDREEDWGLKGRVVRGPADPAIFAEQNASCIAKDMESKGVYWDRANNARKNGWEAMRRRMRGSLPGLGGGPREEAGLYVCRKCQQWLETTVSIPRDDKDPDDVDSDSEDHAADESRYRVMNSGKKASTKRL